MLKRLLYLLGLVLFSLSAWAQLPEATVTRNVVLRSQASTDSTKQRTLQAGEELEVLQSAPANGFYKVRTDLDETGWVYGKFIHIEQEEDAEPLVAVSATGAAGQVDPDWDKPQVAHSTLTMGQKSCPPAGKGGDEETNRRKNRPDAPQSYHKVSWAAVRNLEYPKAPKHYHDWTPEQRAIVEPYQGIPVTVEGYLVALKPQDGGAGEATNCKFTSKAGTDWHMALVEKYGDEEKTSIVVETTPRLRKKHPHWTEAAVKPWVKSKSPVRISGWLMIDPEHRNHLKKYRATLWEIHPITRIEVWSAEENRWVDLDE